MTMPEMDFGENYVSGPFCYRGERVFNEQYNLLHGSELWKNIFT